ncbi:MAG: sulfatase-like hydrolase/transferase [Planctomycetota bacterium]|jgi:arylsulfatase A-like enzyme
MKRPNLLLITTDKQRFDALGANGNRVLMTPTLDRLAATGVNFTNAFTTCPSCVPARRTILSGQEPATHGLTGYNDTEELPPLRYTLPGLLSRAGYQTQLIGKLHQHPQGKRFGFENAVFSEVPNNRMDSPIFGRDEYAEWLAHHGPSRDPWASDPGAHGLDIHRHDSRPFHLGEQYHQTSWLAQKAVEFVTRRRDPSCPWFLHLSFVAPHAPLTPPEFYYRRYHGRTEWEPRIGSWVPDFGEGSARSGARRGEGPYDAELVRDAMAGYYGLINHVDDRVSYLLMRLFERGTARADEPLWIIFTSDHGDQMGDHHLFKIFKPYQGCVHLPFIVSGRNVPLPAGGPTCPALVCLEDLLPTFCELAGVEVPADANVDGKSLAPLLRGEADAVRDELHGEHDGTYANHYLVRGRYKYIWYSQANEEQLFDLAEDPSELSDLSGDAALLAPMREAMARQLAGRADAAYEPAALRPLENRTPSCYWPERPGAAARTP